MRFTPHSVGCADTSNWQGEGLEIGIRQAEMRPNAGGVRRLSPHKTVIHPNAKQQKYSFRPTTSPTRP